MAAVEMQPIGRVRSTRTEPVDDDWDAVESTVELDPERFGPEAVAGLEEFSHVEVVYVFDRVDPASVQTASRHPRGNPDWPEVGIFAQRGSGRPNRIGVTVCRLLAVDGRTVTVHALDAIDGTPVLDLKPYLAEFAPRGEVRQPPWSHELMISYGEGEGCPLPPRAASNSGDGPGVPMSVVKTCPPRSSSPASTRPELPSVRAETRSFRPPGRRAPATP